MEGDKMRTCIICKQEKEIDEFNIEHVILESAGGTYKINNVCERCNNLFGNTIDGDFLRNPLIKILLIHYDIRNKKGRLPRLFKNNILSTNPKIKGTPVYNDRTSELENIKYQTYSEVIDGKLHLKFDSLESLKDVFRDMELNESERNEIRDKILAMIM